VQEQERRRIRRSGFAIENIEAIDFDGTIENRRWSAGRREGFGCVCRSGNQQSETGGGEGS
jgi:hypothetical protein